MTTRLRTRTFVLCFVPFALLLAGSFWMVQGFVERTVRDGLRHSLRENQLRLAGIHSKGDLQNSRFLSVAGENAALKAGIQLALSHPNSAAARATVEDQLHELGQHMGFDLLLVTKTGGAPLAGVIRQHGVQTGSQSGSKTKSQLIPMDLRGLDHVSAGLMQLGGRLYQVASVPVDLESDNLGSLAVGELFDFSEFTTPVVLLENGKAIASNIPGVTPAALDGALTACSGLLECDLRFKGGNWISLPVDSYGAGYQLRSLENVDAAMAPMQSRLNNLFITLSAIFVLVAMLCSLGASRAIAGPIAMVVLHLRRAARTGVLTQFKGRSSSIEEIRELIDIYNRASVSVRAAGENLQAAYLEFIGSLANALDARDPYTAGHSRRVSQLACAAAAAMDHDPEDVERVRVGALLHDIGKIGIADSVLQNPGRLTSEEFALVRQHPVIGRHILEGVHGLAPFLDAVELHHENWDGTGYPKGLVGEQTPLDARIIHVADAYDAMTTDRSYRRGYSHERAIAVLKENAGTQFDPAVVDVVIRVTREILPASSISESSVSASSAIPENSAPPKDDLVAAG